MKEIQTGKSQFRIVISAILNRLEDKDSVVTNAAVTSLRRLSKLHSNKIIFECCAFCNESKLKRDHLLQVMGIIHYVTQEYMTHIDGDGVILLVNFCMKQITEQVEDVQKTASEILVEVGKQHPVQIIEVLTKSLENSCKEISENSTSAVHSVVLCTLGSLAAANPYAVIPHMKHMFTLLLPLLGITKNETYNALAYVMGRFGDALQEYLFNGDKVPDPTITKEFFQMEINFICDSLITHLPNVREPKEHLLALASVLPVASGEKVCQYMQNSLPLVLIMCKKQKELFAAVQCLSSIIAVSLPANGFIIEPHLSSSFGVLVDLVQPEQDYAQPHLVRVHNEALRCLENLSKHFTDYCVDHLLKLLKYPTNDKNRLKSLIIFNHIINAVEDVVNNKIGNLLQILNDMLDNSSVTVKKMLLRTIVILSCKNLLTTDTQLQCYQFILRMCDYFKQEKSVTANQEIKSLRETAEHTLYLLSTTVPQLSDTLGNILLQSLLQGNQHPVILRCLVPLASLKTEFWETPNINVVVRCLIILGKPFPIARSQNTLKFLQFVRPCKSDCYKVVWENQIPQMIKYLEQSEQLFIEVDWLNLIANFLSMLLEAVQDEEFTDSVIYAIRTELDKNLKDDVELLLRLLAVTTCHLKKDQQVSSNLKSILKVVPPYDTSRLNACAKALGICSKSHLKSVLEELQLIRKDLLHKGHHTLMEIVSGHHKSDIILNKMRILLLTAYSEICSNPVPELLQLIEKDILNFAVAELSNCKDVTVRSCCLNAIESVAKAMHPDRNSLNVRMQDKSVVIQNVSGQLQLHCGPEFVQLFPQILSVLTALIKLPPPLDADQRVQLLNYSVNTILKASGVYCKMSEDGTKYGDLKLACFVYNSFTPLNLLVHEIFLQNPDHFALDELVILIKPWLGRKKPEQRLPALEILQSALSTYIKNCQFVYGVPGGFSHCGELVASLIPRCADTNKNVRTVAVQSIKISLCIAARHDGHAKEHDKIINQKMKNPMDNICTDESRMLCNLMMDVAHAAVNHVPRAQIPQFILGLVDSLVDTELQSCYTSSLVLNSVIKIKCGDVPEHITPIMDKLLLILNKIECTRTRATSLRSIVTMAINYPKIVINNLLNQPLPYQQVICDCWAVLTTDESVVLNFFDYFKKIFQLTASFEEKHVTIDTYVAGFQPLQAICALNEICKNVQLQSLTKQQFPDLFCRLIIVIASYSEVEIPVKEIQALKPTNLCVQTAKQVLICCGYEDVAKVFPDSGIIELKDVLDIIPQLTKEMCIVASDILPLFVSTLAPLSRSELIPWRTCATKFLASLLEYNIDISLVLAENVIEILLGCQSDSNFVVRQIAFYGLGVALEKLHWDTTSRYCDGIVDAFLRTLEYYNGKEELQVVLECMLSFSKLLKTLEKNQHQLSSFQVTAAVRIKPLFDQENADLRAASFCFLGDLASSSFREKNADAFKEQIYGDFVPLLLHLVDENEDVIQGCKYALERIAPILNSPKISKTIQRYISINNMGFTEFTTEFVAVLGEELQELLPVLLQVCASYWKTECIMIKAHALLLARIIVQEINSTTFNEIPMVTLSHRLLSLCEDPDPYVRAQAVKTVSSFFLQ